MLELSIIVPAYNVEEYIEECIDSILKQSFKHYEIIVINDGSTDNTLNKLEKYRENPKMKVITTLNNGLSFARNLGMKLAKGNYIMFLDSDDFLSEETLNTLVKEIKKDKLDILAYNFIKDYAGKKIEIKREIKEKKIITGQCYLKLNLEKNQSFPMAWLNIYNRSFLIRNNLFFMEKILYEDTEFNIRLLFKVKRMKYLDLNVVNYRQRKGSITNSAPKLHKQLESYYKILKTYDIYRTIASKNLKNLLYNLIASYSKNFLFLAIKLKEYNLILDEYVFIRNNIKNTQLIRYKILLKLMPLIKVYVRLRKGIKK